MTLWNQINAKDHLFFLKHTFNFSNCFIPSVSLCGIQDENLCSVGHPFRMQIRSPSPMFHFLTQVVSLSVVKTENKQFLCLTIRELPSEWPFKKVQSLQAISLNTKTCNYCYLNYLKLYLFDLIVGMSENERNRVSMKVKVKYWVHFQLICLKIVGEGAWCDVLRAHHLCTIPAKKVSLNLNLQKPSEKSKLRPAKTSRDHSKM